MIVLALYLVGAAGFILGLVVGALLMSARDYQRSALKEGRGDRPSPPPQPSIRDGVIRFTELPANPKRLGRDT